MQSRVQLFTARSGGLSAKAVFDDNSFRHIHSLVAPEAEADLYEGLEFFGDLVVFCGFGLGHHVARKIRLLPASAAVVVMDYYEQCLAHAKKTLFSTIPNRIFFASSENAAARGELIRFVNECAGASVQIVRHPASYDINREFYDSLLECVNGVFLAARQARPAATQSVMLCYGNFFLEEEVRRALGMEAGEPELFRYNEFRSGAEIESVLSKAVQRIRPRCILSINMKGFDGQGMLGQVASRFSIPVAIWFVDDPRPILASHRSHIPKNAVAFCWEKYYLRLLRSAGFSKAEFLPLGGDPLMFSEKPGTVATTNLGFVGTSMVDRFAGNIREKFLWSDTLAPLVENLALRLLADPSCDVSLLLYSACRQPGISLPFSDERNLTWLCAYITHFASMLKRKTIVGALVPLGIETFGDPEGWKELLGKGIVAHPNIDYRRDLAAVYSGIKINLNITSCQMPSAVNQRVFDIPLASSFVLSDRQADLGELFEPDEIATYWSMDELREKVAFYAGNESERKRIVQKSKARILAAHTYRHRIAKMLSVVN